MIRLNIHQAKTHLSRYLRQLAKGEAIVLCRRNVPIAEIRPLPPVSRGKRPTGLGKGTYSVPESFFEPLPDDVLHGFGEK
ncbi:MAG: type II toxin-antitoxin system Phd/YefM family antitoxin [Bryobacteraceae bacterium]